jgi:GxxExxY protein
MNITIDDLNKLTEQVIGIAISVHKQLGPGLAEKIYQRVLYLELKKAGLKFERECKIVVHWYGVVVGYHIVDFKINDILIVEIKATGETQELHKYQLLSYLKAANKPLGLLLNFGAPVLGIKRMVNNL